MPMVGIMLQYLLQFEWGKFDCYMITHNKNQGMRENEY